MRALIAQYCVYDTSVVCVKCDNALDSLITTLGCRLELANYCLFQSVVYRVSFI